MSDKIRQLRGLYSYMREILIYVYSETNRLQLKEMVRNKSSFNHSTEIFI